MGSLIAIVMLGFVLGMRHATDPDHVVAVTTIVSRQSSVRSAALVGAFWGLGHTLTILAVGGAIILFDVIIPPRLGLSMELAVGIMLVLLGVLNLTGVTQRIIERLAPGDAGHLHLRPQGPLTPRHSSGRAADQGGRAQDLMLRRRFWHRLRQGEARLGFYGSLRPLLVGIVHGLAGSAAVALLVLASIHKPAWAAAYLLIFGTGTVAGMMMITAAIAVPYAYTGRRFVRLNSGLAAASGLLSLGFGLFIAYRIGFVDGLFTGHPHWTPH